jgi:cell division protein FtsI (penicillin-binding protein 3)
MRLGDATSTSVPETVRGTIYDRNYKEFAVSYERVSVYANIREINELGKVIQSVARIINIPEEDLYERVEEGNLRIWLAKDISQEQEEQIRALSLPGVYLHREYVRYYPQEESAAHLVGFVDGDTGLAGVEQYFNQLETSHRMETNATDSLPEVMSSRPGIDGRHLILTLDLKIQQILDRYLEQFSASNGDIRIGSLVLEADTGAIIGYSQIPSFDPNAFSTYPATAFSDVFTEIIAVPEQFKVFLRDVSLLESQVQPGSRPLPWSVVAEKRKLGLQLQLWDRLGAGTSVRPDFVTRQQSVLDRVAHDPPGVGKRNFETVPVMQTPLQLVTAITRIVNGGKAITPYSVDRFVLRKNQKEYLLEDLGPDAGTGTVDEYVSVEARELFRLQGQPGPVSSSVLTGLSGSYRVADGMSSFRNHYVSIGLIPVKKPELVMLIVASYPGNVTEPEDWLMPGSEAMELISPIVALQRVMKNLADMMSPGNRKDMNFPTKSLEDPSTGQVGVGRREGAPKEVKMPELRGFSLRKSIRLLQHVDVSIEVLGTGRVVRQEPSPGSVLEPGTRVFLTLERDLVDASFKQQPDETEQ